MAATDGLGTIAGWRWLGDAAAIGGAAAIAVIRVLREHGVPLRRWQY
jgi:hypothetical protein